MWLAIVLIGKSFLRVGWHIGLCGVLMLCINHVVPAGFNVPINLITLGIAGIFGLPGMIGLYLINLIF
jgi:hypothetical protein